MTKASHHPGSQEDRGRTRGGTEASSEIMGGLTNNSTGELHDNPSSGQGNTAKSQYRNYR